ncbi:GNAT family N-acetyltransferase [Dactylosporangium sp. NPDC049140]|uniref:GNAT family N-acetyltransferase n=1 Tax=Dactylosporangium sp. NPDC049140 TaxID=3155647 RepID=UPI0033FCB376
MLNETIRIEAYTGDRNRLRDLFALAEDAPIHLDAYLHAGRVLVAVHSNEIVGYCQLVETATSGQLELTSLAVRESEQRRGIGARLVRAALDLAAAEQAAELVVLVAEAGVGGGWCCSGAATGTR